MRLFSFALIACLVLFTMTFAAEGESMEPQGTVTITVEPLVKHVDAYTAATAFVKASDYAPEGGWGEKDYGKVYETIFSKGFDRITGWLNADRQPAGPFFGIYFDDPEKTPAGELSCKVGVPITGEQEPTADIVIEEIPAGDVASITYKGDYKNSSNAWDALVKFVEAEGYAWAGAPMEIYIVSEGQTDNPEEWVTEVRWPVMKKGEEPKEMMEEPAKTEE